MASTKRQTLYLLLSGLLLSIGTPVYLALSHPGIASYLLQPEIFAGQSLPYILGAIMWLPWRSPRACALGKGLAVLLLLAASLLYIPMLVGLWPTGGDMVGLAFLLIAAVMTVSLVLITLAVYGILLFRQRVPQR